MFFSKSFIFFILLMILTVIATLFFVDSFVTGDEIECALFLILVLFYIVGTISIGIFFLTTFRKENKHTAKIIVSSGLTLCFVISLYIAINLFGINSYFKPTEKFDSTSWKFSHSSISLESRTARSMMVSDLMKNGQLKGKSRKKVLEILGSAEFIEPFHDISEAHFYYLCTEQVFFKTQLCWLIIYYDQNDILDNLFVTNYEYFNLCSADAQNVRLRGKDRGGVRINSD